MKNLIERHQIKEGGKFRINDKMRTGIDQRTGLQYWKFPVAFTEEVNNELVVYSYVWLRSTGKCPYKVGDWVLLKRIKAYTPSSTRNQMGGRTIFTTLEVDFESAKNNNGEE